MQKPSPPAMVNTAGNSTLKVPVEVLENGEKTEWVMVEVNNEAIPEPGTMTLVATLSTLLLLRRQREE